MRFIAALLAFSSLLLAQTPAAPAPKKIQALIITGQNGHDWRTVCPLLRKALEDTGRFEVRIDEEFRGAGPETLAAFADPSSHSIPHPPTAPYEPARCRCAR